MHDVPLLALAVVGEHRVECVVRVVDEQAAVRFALALVLFFFNVTATTEIYTLSLHDALPIFRRNISDFRSQIAGLNAQQSRSISNLKSAICNRSRLPLLVSSGTGYQNLCRLITKMKLRAKKEEGAVREQELEEHAAGLICLTGGNDGPLAAALAEGGFDEAVRQVGHLTEIFGRNNVYVELQRHLHRDEEARNRAAI